MPYLRPNDRLVVSTLDGWSDFILQEPLPLKTRDGRFLRGRVGASTDGLSSPKFIKCDLQSTNSFFPTVTHDNSYRGDLEESLDNGVTWNRVDLTKQECDSLLFELCEDNFVPPWEAKAIYDAVAEFGQKSWDDDAKFRAEAKT